MLTGSFNALKTVDSGAFQPRDAQREKAARLS